METGWRLTSVPRHNLPDKRMPLSVGTNLGPYENLAPIGAGAWARCPGLGLNYVLLAARALSHERERDAVAERESECCRSDLRCFTSSSKIRLSSDVTARFAIAKAVLLWILLASLATRFDVLSHCAIEQKSFKT
jgi:hypothetical protein